MSSSAWCGRPLKEHLCADKGYQGGAALMRQFGYELHICPRGKKAAEAKKEAEKAGVGSTKKSGTKKPRRWVVESCHSWLKRWRKIHTRYEKTVANFTALVVLGAALTAFPKALAI